jgi:signal transduction histidine kinase
MNDYIFVIFFIIKFVSFALLAAGISFHIKNNFINEATENKSIYKRSSLYYFLILLFFFAGEFLTLFTGSFASPQNLPTGVQLIAKIPYRLALFPFLILVFSKINYWRNFFKSKAHFLSLFTVVPYVVLFASNATKSSTSSASLGVEFLLFVVTILTMVAATPTLMTTREKNWGYLTAGIMILCLAGWGKRYQLLLGSTEASPIYECIWTIGMFLVVKAGMVKPDNEFKNIFSESKGGIIENIRFYILLIMFLFITSLHLLGKVNPLVAQLTTVFSALAVIIAFMAGEGILKAVQSFSENLKKMNLNFSEEKSCLISNSTLPVELKDQLEAFFNFKISEIEKVNQQNLELQILREKSSLYGKLNHDLKAPIMALKSRIQIGPLDREEKETLFLQIEKIKAMINGIVLDDRAPKINFNLNSKEIIEKSNRMESTCHLLGLINSVIDDTSPIMNSNGVRLIMNIDPSIQNIFIAGDFMELSRALNNLMMNAIQSSVERARRISLSTTINQQKGNITLMIRDFGKGIPQNIFESINQDEIISTKHSGFGQGIKNAREFIKRADGNLTFINSPEGATALIELKLLDTPAWYFDIRNSKNNSFIILDDDLSVINTLKQVRPDAEFSITDDEKEFITSAVLNKSAFCLVDLSFGGNRNGLDLIIQEQLQSRSALFSGRISFDKDLFDYAFLNKVNLLPKESVNFKRELH